MSIATALVAIKTANATLNTLIGTRFHPDALPQDVTLPAVCFQEVSRTRDYTFGVALPPLSHPVVMMKCYATTSVGRNALAAAVRAAFTSTTSQSVGGVTVDGMSIDNEFSGGVELLGTSAERYVQILYIRLHIKE
jgi:hypothetical protein